MSTKRSRQQLAQHSGALHEDEQRELGDARGPLGALPLSAERRGLSAAGRRPLLLVQLAGTNVDLGDILFAQVGDVRRGESLRVLAVLAEDGERAQLEKVDMQLREQAASRARHDHRRRVGAGGVGSRGVPLCGLV